jgi:hypothetical protein
VPFFFSILVVLHIIFEITWSGSDRRTRSGPDLTLVAGFDLFAGLALAKGFLLAWGFEQRNLILKEKRNFNFRFINLRNCRKSLPSDGATSW